MKLQAREKGAVGIDFGTLKKTNNLMVLMWLLTEDTQAA